MKEQDKARLFSEAVDRMLEGHREIPEELGEMMSIAVWLMERGEEPMPPFRRRLEDALRERWITRQGAFPAPRKGWWPWPSLQLYSRQALSDLKGVKRWALAAVLTVFLIGSVLLIPPQVRGVAARSLEAGMEILLQRVSVREVKPQRRWELPPSQVPTYTTVAEAQQHVDFPIREPAYLPPGFRLEGVQVANPSSASLGYRRETEVRGIELIYLLQSSLAGKTDRYAEYPGEIRQIELQGRRAVWGANKRGMDVLIWEDGDMLFVLHSTLPLTEMQKVAISLFDE